MQNHIDPVEGIFPVIATQSRPHTGFSLIRCSFKTAGKAWSESLKKDKENLSQYGKLHAADATTDGRGIVWTIRMDSAKSPEIIYGTTETFAGLVAGKEGSDGSQTLMELELLCVWDIEAQVFVFNPITKNTGGLSQFPLYLLQVIHYFWSTSYVKRNSLESLSEKAPTS